MTVRLLLPRALAEHAGGVTEVAIETSGERPLREVLALVTAEHPALGRRIVDETGALRAFVNVFVDGEECRRLRGLDTAVPECAQLHVIGSIAGG